jgi:hypothetical protein
MADQMGLEQVACLDSPSVLLRAPQGTKTVQGIEVLTSSAKRSVQQLVFLGCFRPDAGSKSYDLLPSNPSSHSHRAAPTGPGN